MILTRSERRDLYIYFGQNWGIDPCKNVWPLGGTTVNGCVQRTFLGHILEVVNATEG